jgi:hypothetical protein
VYEILKKNHIPMATHFFVNRKDTPEITQEYLESLGERQKCRGEELIRAAKEWRETHKNFKSQPMSPFSGEREENVSTNG